MREKTSKTIFRTPALIAACLSILFSAHFLVFGQNVSSDLSNAEKIAAFDKIWSTINEKYYDANFNGTDWKRVGETYRPLILEAGSDEQFYALLDRMAGELRDSHTRVISPLRRQAARSGQTTSAGLIISEVEGVFTVLSVAEGSEGARAGIKSGMQILAVNGIPAVEAFDRAQIAVGASSSERATRLRAFSAMLAGKDGSQINLTLALDGGEEFAVRLTRRKIKLEPNVTARILSSGIAYLKFNSFDETTSDKVKIALKKLKSAPALILDLRNNGGGDGEEGLRVAGFFLNKSVPLARLVTRDGKPPAPDIPMVLAAGRKGGQIFENPVVILTNEATASTAELFTAALQENKRARVVGSQTCGCVLGFINYNELAGGGAFTFSEFGFITPQGKTLEGAGVTPDRAVKLTVSDLRNQRDAALAEAETYLNLLVNQNFKSLLQTRRAPIDFYAAAAVFSL